VSQISHHWDATAAGNSSRCIAAACDVRMMSQGKIGLAELSVGVPFPPVAMEILRHAIGPAVSHLVLTAGLLDPAQARSIGLVHAVTGPNPGRDRRVSRRAQATGSRVRTPSAVRSANGSQSIARRRHR
jgi:enoyl-CoA hydratase/carnithine racemase